MQYIAFDSHKKYTWARVEDQDGRKIQEVRINHDRGALHGFLETCEPGSPVAVETMGNWYWITDEIEAAGMVPRLVHAGRAKWMLGMRNKTDKLDAKGLNRLQRAGTLPTVWIPPGELRDARDLPRTRMVLVQQRTRLKNRIHATLAKYAIKIDEASDIFGERGRRLLEERLKHLPEQTRFATESLLEQLDQVEEQVQAFEERMEVVFSSTPEVQRLESLPGVGFILAVVIATEVGDVRRFPRASQLASYAGTTPTVRSSGGKIRHGRLPSDVNRYLKWAFIEAANVVCINRRRSTWRQRHVSRLYERIRQRRGHPQAVGAVARHLAEATYWMLKKGETYRDPGHSSTEAQARGWA